MTQRTVGFTVQRNIRNLVFYRLKLANRHTELFSHLGVFGSPFHAGLDTAYRIGRQ